MSEPDMSQLLSSVYATGADPSDEDKEKIAAATMFTDLCKEQGINVDDLNDDQLSYLWKHAMEGEEGEKTCAECKEKMSDCKCPSKESSAKEAEVTVAAEEAKKLAEAEVLQKQAAHEEWNEKRAAAEKIAEADALGRIMAHAYVDELRKVAAEGEGGGGLPPAFKEKAEEKKEEKKEEGGEGEKDKESSAQNESQQKAAAIIEEIEKSKQASGGQPTQTAQLDHMAANKALEMLKSAEVDEAIALERVQAVYTLGLPDSVKIAQVQGFEEALEVRALEFVEAAGFPVNWSAE